MDLAADLNRRVESLLRLGTVAETDYSDPAKPRVRVQSGGLLGDWIAIPGSAGAVKTWNPPHVGEQVLVAAPSGEYSAGYVVAAYHSNTNQAPGADGDEVVITFPDGARIAYHHGDGALTADGIKTCGIKASESATVEAPQVTLKGDVKIDGKLEVTGTSKFTGLSTFDGGTIGDRI